MRGLGGMIIAALLALTTQASADDIKAQDIKIGTIKVAGAGALFIAQQRGYFAAEGLNPQFVFFEAAQPIAVANVSGDVDFGATPPTAGFYALAGQGALRIIAGYIMDWPSFQANGAIVSLAAYDKGFHSFQDMAGKTVSTTQIGAAPHYAWALIAEHFGVDFKTVHVTALQSNSNQLTAAIGGQVDAAMMPSTFFTQALQAGKVKLLGYAGDIVPWQLGGVFTSTKMANEHADTVRRFLRAYKRGVQDYHDAFTGPDEKRRDGPQAAAIIEILGKYLGQTAEQLKPGISYLDADARLDAKDVQHQIDWYKSQGLMKGDIKAGDLLDKRYATVLPGRN